MEYKSAMYDDDNWGEADWYVRRREAQVHIQALASHTRIPTLQTDAHFNNTWSQPSFSHVLWAGFFVSHGLFHCPGLIMRSVNLRSPCWGICGILLGVFFSSSGLSWVSKSPAIAVSNFYIYTNLPRSHLEDEGRWYGVWSITLKKDITSLYRYIFIIKILYITLTASRLDYKVNIYFFSLRLSRIIFASH